MPTLTITLDSDTEVQAKSKRGYYLGSGFKVKRDVYRVIYSNPYKDKTERIRWYVTMETDNEDTIDRYYKEQEEDRRRGQKKDFNRLRDIDPDFARDLERDV